MTVPKRDDIRSPIWDLNLIPDQTGKVALVTGANVTTGIGWNTANELAKKGAHVIIHARSEEKAQTAIDAILKESPSVKKENLSSFIAEFSDLKALKKAAEGLVSKLDRLDLLFNNAGILARKLDKDSATGISVSILTNHFATFVLTTSLLPLLKKTSTLPNADVRIITLSSTTHTLIPGHVQFKSKDDFNVSFGAEDGMPSNIQRYGLAKLANLLMAKELQRLFDSEGVPIISVSLHPGGVRTPGAEGFVQGQLGGNMALLDSSLTPLQGAVTSLFAATSGDVRREKAKFGGRYLMPFGVASDEDESADAKDPALATELWKTTENVLKEILA